MQALKKLEYDPSAEFSYRWVVSVDSSATDDQWSTFQKAFQAQCKRDRGLRDIGLQLTDGNLVATLVLGTSRSTYDAAVKYLAEWRNQEIEVTFSRDPEPWEADVPAGFGHAHQFHAQHTLITHDVDEVPPTRRISPDYETVRTMAGWVVFPDDQPPTDADDALFRAILTWERGSTKDTEGHYRTLLGALSPRARYRNLSAVRNVGDLAEQDPTHNTWRTIPEVLDAVPASKARFLKA